MKKSTNKLKVPDDMAELICNMHPHLKKNVRASLQTILTDPHSGKALKDELAGLRSFRVGRFRIIYRVSDQKLVEIVAIGPRENIYEETFRLLKREENAN
ncbi:MAG: type II toxin-antitoxin system RelE/ParE family toxin [Planctomycetota bacterium]|jgi:mRNA interferase RelE/StbE